MNRRDLFKGAAATAMTCLAPLPEVASFDAAFAGWGSASSSRDWIRLAPNESYTITGSYEELDPIIIFSQEEEGP